MPKLKKKSIQQRRLISKEKMRERRQDASLQPILKETDRISKINRRQNEEVRLNNNSCNKLCQRKRLLITENQNLQREKLRVSQAKRLENEELKQVHKMRNSLCQKMRLENDERKEVHKMRNSHCQKKRLENDKVKQLHKMRIALCQKKRLENDKLKQIHKMRNSLCQKMRLENDERKRIHKMRISLCQKKRLENDERKRIHKMRISLCQKKRLSTEKNRQIHCSRLRICQNRRLQNPLLRVRHNLLNQSCQSKRLKNKTLLKKHRRYMKAAQHKRLRIIEYRKRHNKQCQLNYRRSKNMTQNVYRTKLFSKYNADVKDGPFWECVSCCRLFFKSSVTFCDVKMFKNIPLQLLEDCCSKMQNDNVIGYLCSCCKTALRRNRTPKFSLYHKGLQFPPVPDNVKKLTSLEERFICPRIPFMQIRTIGGNQQYSVKGRVVNVPTDVANNVDVLPRLARETDVIAVAFRRKKNYKSNVLFQTVRPNVILDALKTLKNCAVFKEANVTVEDSKINEIRVLQENDSIEGELDVADNESDSDSDAEPINVPADHTLLSSEAIVFAPGENFQPIPLFLDTQAEAMSFIKIYGGEIKEYPRHMSYQEISKSEIMQSDRRVASSVDKLFFVCTYLRAQKVSNSISICLRKSSGKQNATVGAVLANDFIKSITVHDSGFKVFTPDRGSPAFWEMKKKDLFAMIRQIGPPTFFITLSPAETKWAELLVILKKVVDGVEITENDAISLPYQEKVKLIKHDPVTCALYFNFRLRKLFTVLRAKNSVFREHDLVDSYTRIEFQQRGSPHAHCLLWLNQAPKFNPGDAESAKECERFVERFVSCEHDHSDLSNDLIKFQTHKHTFTCWKKKKNEKKCRFGVPVCPMRQFKILEPLGDAVDKIELKKHKADFVKIRASLDNMYRNEQDITFDEFLSQINLSEEEYIMAIRSSLKRPKCFLKRSLKDIRINAYNPEILSLHRSNMDIQFITDVYSCAMYVLNYINKSTGGMSKILRDAKKEIQKGDLSLKERLRILANKFLNASEFSAQEAVYYVLSLPLSICSRSTVFVNTSLPEKRVCILKTNRELRLLPGDSTDIFKKGVIEHYVERPEKLNDICLAEFAAYYTYSSSKNLNSITLDDENHDWETISEPESMQNVFQTTNGVFTKRSKPKVLRYVRFNVETDESNYYREQLMLFLPWKIELDDIINVNHKIKFLTSRSIILNNRAKFIHEDSGDNVPTDCIDLALQANNDSESENSEVDDDNNDNNNPFAILNDGDREPDIFTDIGVLINKKTADEVSFPVPHMVDDNIFEQMVRTLNYQQRKYMLHVLNCHKLKKDALYECVLGGAGVGKSRLIDTIHQTLLRFYNTQESTDLESLKVLICAPTGKAAFNIKGVTLHSAFVLPLNQFGYEMPQLSSSVSNSILSKLRDLKLIIIDEISMVGSKVFGQINLRLQQIFRSSEPFAGKSIIVFGDFNQLSPVGDKYIFKPDPSNPYSDLVGNPLWEKFSFFVLTEIMRQKDDTKFAIALNNLAEGTLTNDEVDMFTSRINRSEPPETIRLFRSNAEVDSFNENVLKKQPDVISVEAFDKVIGKVHETVKKSLLTAIKDFKVASTYGLPRVLKLSVGILYMLTNNIKVNDGLVNGAVGILKHIEMNDAGIVRRLWVYFTDPIVGKETRNEFKHVSIAKNIDQSLTPIAMLCKNVKPRQNSLAMVTRKQFPLVPAEAITIYKSQGGTYNSAVVNLKPGMKRNEIYVALSRVTSLNGLFIKGDFIPPKITNDEVSRVIKTSIKEKPVKMNLLFLDEKTTDFTIVFHNIQSLRKHHGDLKADHFLMCASIIALVETWTLPSDSISITGYTEVYRVDVAKTYRHAYGIVIYSKAELEDQCQIIFEYHCEDKQTACNLAVLKIREMTICVVYKPPSTYFGKVKSLFDKMIDYAHNSSHNIIVLGDFNINLMHHRGKCLDTWLSSKELTNKIINQPSTTGMTQIDVCYSNMNELSASYFESYYSYHKPIVCVVGGKETNISGNNNASYISEVNSVDKTVGGFYDNLEDVVDIAVIEVEKKKLPPGFKNLDNVSCYANSVCQCVLFIKHLRDAVMSENDNIMTTLGKSYMDSVVKTLSSFEVRQLIDFKNGIQMFTLNEQQDVPEFINYLSFCFPRLVEVSQHTLCHQYKCTKCRIVHTGNTETNLILPLYINGIKTTSLKKLFEKSYDTWGKTERECNVCRCNDSMMLQTKVGLTSQCSVLFLQLMLFSHNGSNVVKNRIILKNLHKEYIQIGDAIFKIGAIISHHGSTLHEGHYTCKLRNGDSWFEANDTKVTQCNVPEIESDAYVIIIEKC